jgi:hypothetical protein
MMSEWREQYDRMKRWRETMATDRGNRERVTDIFFAFAQTCYHMVDWLANDASQPIRKGEAKDYVFNSDALSFCAEICNGAKHARLEEKDVDLSVTESMVTDYRFHVGEERKSTRETIVQRLSLEWQGRPVLALRFADQCIAEWDQLLTAHRLLTS